MWKLQDTFIHQNIPQNKKTLFFAGNGYLGIQAASPEIERVPGTFINGFYEKGSITYGEHAFGYPNKKQVMIPLVDLWSFSLLIRLSSGEYQPMKLEKQIIQIDMHRGIRTIFLSYMLPDNSLLSCTMETLVSFQNPHRIYTKFTCTGEGDFRLVRRITAPDYSDKKSHDPRRGEGFDHEVIKKSRMTIHRECFYIEETTTESRLSYGCAFNCFPDQTDMSLEYEDEWKNDSTFSIYQDFHSDLQNNFSTTMIAAFYTTIETDAQLLKEKSESELANARKNGWKSAEAGQQEFLDRFWNGSEIRIGNDPELTRGLLFSTYGLLQSTGTDGFRSAPAKGLSSDGYNGHYFWDADIYVQSALNLIHPPAARSLLQYRIDHLDEARKRACELSEKGALYPWRTINGDESSAFFPAGTAQFHINSDIVWGLKEYLLNTGDTSILHEGGAEMLFETARFWANFVVFVSEKGYCIHCVTGPDEYTALVNNNFYTNYMVMKHLDFACRTADLLKSDNNKFYSTLSEKILLTDEEISVWNRIAEGIYLPADPDSGIFLQDDSFMEKAPWNWESTPKEKRPLLLHYHPLKIYRHRVLKQPDVIMAMLLERGDFNRESFKTNYEFYDPLTSGDSSLTSAIQSGAAALSGKTDAASAHFRKTVLLDLTDSEGNTDNGIHLASMAGARMALIFGFAGYHITGEGPEFNPQLPKDWETLSFSLRYREISLKICIRGGTSFLIEASGDIAIKIKGRAVQLQKDLEKCINLDG